jgi:predicted transcriptional regulator
MLPVLDPIRTAATQIINAWRGSHEIDPSALPDLIRAVHESLSPTDSWRIPAPRMAPTKGGRTADDTSRPAGTPAVEIRKSVFADHLICLEDGKRFKTLTRHLNETHGMTPAQYRAKWDLPDSYPMMAPDYSKVRSALSKATGIGKRR